MKTKNQMFKGIYALLLTPFQEDLAIDWKTYDQYVDWQLSHRPDHLFASCGTSEMKDLILEERLKLAKIAVERAGKVPVVATANMEFGLDAQVDEIKRMEDTGVAGLVFTTKGMGADQQKLQEYLENLCQHTKLPVILYEFPGYPNYFIQPDTYKKLVDGGQIIGLKDTTCTLEGIQAKIEQSPSSIVLQANIPWLLESLRLGAGGVMTTVSSSAVQLVLKLWHSMGSDPSRLDDIQAQLTLLSSVTSNGFPSSSKLLAALQGVPMLTVSRGNQKLPSQRVQAIQTFYDWAHRHQIM